MGKLPQASSAWLHDTSDRQQHNDTMKLMRLHSKTLLHFFTRSDQSEPSQELELLSLLVLLVEISSKPKASVGTSLISSSTPALDAAAAARPLALAFPFAFALVALDIPLADAFTLAFAFPCTPEPCEGAAPTFGG